MLVNRTLLFRLSLIVAIAIVFSVSPVLAFQATDETKLSPQQNEIKQLTEQFVAAFNKGDAKTIASWTRDGNQWVIECESTTSGGQLATSTNIFTILGDDELRWQSTNRTIDGASIEDTDSIRINRVK